MRPPDILASRMAKKLDKAPDAPATVSDSSETENLFMVLQTIGDTTWRMFVPAVGFTLLGVWLDHIWGTKPWLMVAGIFVGGFGAYLLVAKPFKRVQKGIRK